MFSGISGARVLGMSDLERRWFHNVKRAFAEADQAILSAKPQDHCMEELCKAVDTAKTLRRSLRDEAPSQFGNKHGFVEFLNLEIPAPLDTKGRINLVDARTGKPVSYSIAELVYAIRCMIHENENLNAAEQPDYHVQLDWEINQYTLGTIQHGTVVLNARFIAGRVREILAKFITGLDGMIAIAEGRDFAITIRPPLGSIGPGVRPLTKLN
ncbi:MAG TPA: hypothetical protein VHX68_09120 [Planctomycetaceae bacterium]|nr:hypothetical protein [Planctomycetaceae bacterium]